MMPQQRIVRVRREYNQWVANQTLEDYALRFTAKGSRRWSAFRIANTAIGAISFLALEAIGGTITLNYGFTNAALAILVVGTLIFLTGLPISYYAAKYGVDIDLLTRGAGFGYIGSTITSLIYASFTFIFFAIEAVIMALALEMCLGIPLAAGYVISSLIAIPLVTHGVTFISRFQLWSQPLWIGLHILPFIFIAMTDLPALRDWTAFTGQAGMAGASFNPLLFGAAASVVFSLIAQIGEQVDFLRFLPRQRRGRRLAWWAALLSAGPGWILLGAVKMLVGSFLAVLAFSQGVAFERASEPTQMYLIAFQYVVPSPGFALALAGIFVVVSQLKINVTNAYAGSLAWSNFFSRLTHSHPGRVVWLVFNVAIALILMELGIYKALEQILGLYSNVAVAWVGAIVADLMVNKPLQLSPPFIEFKRAHLYDINPVGVGAMLIATVLSTTAFAGLFGPLLQAGSPFVAFFAAFVSAPIIAYATGGKYYLARQSQADWGQAETLQCCICEHRFEPEDMAHCPAYMGPICSLCCSLDVRCHDSCKESARFSEQILAFLTAVMPNWLIARLNSRIAHYLGVLFVLGLVIAAILTLVYFQATLGELSHRAIIASALWKVFFILLIIAGVTAWLLVLAQESRRVAQEESQRQTTLLMQEIEAHERTDAALQKAKEVAEAANLAKSRYIVGISHEIRTPLNAILGYAQLLDRDSAIPPHRRDAIRVIRRSGDHLAGLIDGLLDISKIEAGRLRLFRNKVHIREFLAQIIDMFRLQASAKGIGFHVSGTDLLPHVVYTDEKRLRQILINLLSNAIKFTEEGEVRLRIRYRGQVAEFEVEDTGIGIADVDLGRIFEPFERGTQSTALATPGTGLGLTITKLLTEVMGGEITVRSHIGRGSVFRVKILLSEAAEAGNTETVEHNIRGYLGPQRTILIADDDDSHRDLLGEILAPLGFRLFVAPNGTECLRLAEQFRPDLVLLDISMPGLDGWQTARALRRAFGLELPIIMISANADERQKESQSGLLHNAYLTKPIDIALLLDQVRLMLHLEWIYESAVAVAVPLPAGPLGTDLPAAQRAELRHLGEIGHIRGIRTKLDEIARMQPEHAASIEQIRRLVDNFDLSQFLHVLEGSRHDDR
jgi:signal transduction histidine kinase/CheY-like chemotaxis protein